MIFRLLSATSARRDFWNVRVLGSLAAALVFGGCAHPSYIDPARVGPYYYPLNHSGDPQLPADIRRVVLLPLAHGDATSSEMSGALDPLLASELQLQNRFEVVALSRDECRRRFGLEEFSSVSAIPPSLLPALRRDFAADAVIFVDLTAYHAYQPLLLGLRGKLISLNPVRSVWTFDNIFAAEDPKVANSARHFYLNRDRQEAPADFTLSVLQSPTRFGTYAAQAMWVTLPPILPPAGAVEPIGAPPDKAR